MGIAAQPGGLYLAAGGTRVNAKGEPVDASAPEADGEAALAPVPLPEGFPKRDLLVRAGLGTVESVRAATDEQLEGINGIGPAAVREIREALRGA